MLWSQEWCWHLMLLLTRLFMSGLLVLVLLTGCSPRPTGDKAAAQAARQESLTKPEFRSEVTGLKIVLTNRLPTNKGRLGESPENCDSIITKPTTPEGKSVQANGWAVFSEEDARGYRSISFAGRADGNAMGICTSENGNIALFKDGALKIIIYAGKGADRIGSVGRFERGDLRIFDSEWLGNQPLADIRFGADGSVAIRPVAAEEKVCGGTALVPNIYGVKLNRAREILLRAAWSPQPDASKDPNGSIQGDASGVAFYASHGLPEAVGCAVVFTVGRCEFAYKSRAGRMEITTNDMQPDRSFDGKWDWPTVLGYDVKCQ